MKTAKEPTSPAPLPRWEMLVTGGHSVQFYEDDAFQLEGLTRFIGAAIAAGDSALVVASKAHRDGLSERLRNSGLDLTIAAQQGRFVAADATETLATFMENDYPDASLFDKVVGGVVAQLADVNGKTQRVAIFGEMVAILWAEGKQQAALELERLWNRLAEKREFQLHCAYPLSLFSQAHDAAALEKICSEHSHVTPAERYSTLTTDEASQGAIAVLQQKAQALETAREQLRRNQEQLHNAFIASQRLAAIVESSDDAIASKDLNGTVTSWNKGAEKMFGYKAEEIIGQPVTLIIPPELHKDEEMILDKIRRGEKIAHFETVRLTKDGERIDVSLTVSPVKDGSGTVVGAAKIVRNITENKKIEHALLTTEKLAATGRLAATVAHEINNPLEAVTNLVYLAKTDLADSSKAVAYLSLASRELERVAHITRQTLGFYRETLSPVRFSITQAIDDLLPLYERRFESRNVKVIKQYRGKMEITALVGEVRQALSNLITNAIDAMPNGGSLVIRVSRAHEWNKSAMAGVRITIMDTGSGIAP
ncbi:MAG TPA: PAS domain S-box protein, partial [Candidatus Angelobacter sp.]|nr:PAS domain S-box protein [Candidatus Angelobacter sp.]